MFSDIEKKQTAEWYYDYFKAKQKKYGLTVEIKDNKDGTCTFTVKDGKGNVKENFKARMDHHENWKEDETADERIRAKVQEIDRRDLWNKAWGSETTGMVETIRAAQKRKINWKNHIRRFFGNIAWRDKEATRKKPNRRTGFVHPGSKRMMVDRHLLGVDTSGSVDSKLLADFLAVMNQILDYCPIDVMEFDSEKQSGPFPFDRRKTEFGFTGRGGTNFQPVIDMDNERKYRSIIFLTDGEAAAPTPPKTAKVLWVLPEGHEPPVEWGNRVHMTRH
jgi:predicted metal-dependent peptidase